MKIVPTHPDQAQPVGMTMLLASSRSTLVLLVYLALSIIVFYQLPVEGRYWLLIPPVVLLMINFIAAGAVRGVMTSNLPLMLFHFALIILVVLSMLGQMSYLKATLELATNEEFAGQLENVRKGAWHDYGLNDVRFTNLGFEINYHKGVKRNNTLNRIALSDADGTLSQVEIGDHVPLVIGHYRFYTSHNKGYAPVFAWKATQAKQSVSGSIHLPAYPTNEYRQALEWQIPGSQLKIWTQLKIEQDVLPLDRDFQFTLPQQHHLVIRYNDSRYELKAGDELELDQGILTYQGLTSWMGYKVDYDWTRPWLLATSLVALFNLFLHFLLKFRKAENALT